MTGASRAWCSSVSHPSDPRRRGDGPDDRGGGAGRSVRCGDAGWLLDAAAVVTLAPGACARTRTANRDAATQVIPLTDRQKQVVRLVRDGLTYQQIGAELGISAETVRVHVQDVAAKYGILSRPLRWLIVNADRVLAA